MSKEGSTKLTYAIKNLRKHWEIAKAHWQDQVADFEANHLFPLETRVNAVIRGMDKRPRSPPRSSATAPRIAEPGRGSRSVRRTRESEADRRGLEPSTRVEAAAPRPDLGPARDGPRGI